MNQEVVILALAALLAVFIPLAVWLKVKNEKRTLRVLVISTSFFTVPGRYGGVEEVVFNLCLALLRGNGLKYRYKIVLAAAKGSGDQLRELGCEVIELFDPYFPSRVASNEWHAFDQASRAFAQRLASSGKYGRFDLISDHTIPGPGYAYGAPLAPTLVTLHNTSPSRWLPAFLSRLPKEHKLAYAAIAQHELEKAQAQGIDNISLCYNGEDVESLSRVAREVSQERYFSFLGRIHPDKDVARAIRIALAAGVVLKIAGRKNDPQYFDEEVLPLIEANPNQIQYLGEISAEEKARFLARSLGMVFPVSWAEGFGMVIVQAWACGVPVFGSRNGSLPELLDPDPRTGVASTDDDVLVRAVCDAAAGIRFSREACFSRALDFTNKRMALAYERAFEDLLAKNR